MTSQMRKVIVLSVLLSLCSSGFSQNTTCIPGYYITDSGGCDKCPKGTFQPDANKTNCKPCPPGKASIVAGSTKCVPCKGANRIPSRLRNDCVCVEGAVEDNGGRCKLCRPGYYFDNSDPEGPRCEDCPKGRYQPESGQTTCLSCPEGTDSHYGAAKCVSCEKGFFLSRDTNKCKTCPPGETLDKRREDCEECEAGTFKAKRGLDPCKFCPAGMDSEDGASECVPGCGYGERPLGKTGKCGRCKAGYYYSDFRENCEKCGLNEFMPFENVGFGCFRCSSGSYSHKRGAKKCIQCPIGQGLMKNGKCASCPPGFGYRHDFKCVKCETNTFNPGNHLGCIDCPLGSFALPGAKECFSCPEGEEFISALKKCGVCDAGEYYSHYGNSCQSCNSNEFSSAPNTARECVTCPDGTVPNKRRTRCISA